VQHLPPPDWQQLQHQRRHQLRPEIEVRLKQRRWRPYCHFRHSLQSRLLRSKLSPKLSSARKLRHPALSSMTGWRWGCRSPWLMTAVDQWRRLDSCCLWPGQSRRTRGCTVPQERRASYGHRGVPRGRCRRRHRYHNRCVDRTVADRCTVHSRSAPKHIKHKHISRSIYGASKQSVTATVAIKRMCSSFALMKRRLKDP